MVEMPQEVAGIENDIEKIEENCVCDIDGFDAQDNSFVIQVASSANRHVFHYIQNSTSLKVSNAETNDSHGLNLKLKPE
jgi:hypothetical protein